MPPFGVGIAAESIGDWNTREGYLPVPETIALAFAAAVTTQGFDVAISYRMRVGHGVTQRWESAQKSDL